MKSIDLDPEIVEKFENHHCDLNDSEAVAQRLTKCDDLPSSSNLHRLDPSSNADVPFYCAIIPAILSGGSDYFGLGSIGPLLPYYVASMNASDQWVGYVTSAQFVGVLIGGIALGRAADLYGLKKVITISLCADAIFFTLTGFCNSPTLLAACRLVAGFFTPLVPSISWVINTSDINPTATKNTVGFNMGVWAFCMSACYMLGSVVGGALGPDKWIELNIISGAVALFACVYMLFMKEPTRSEKGLKPDGLNVIMKQPEFVALLANNLMLGIIFTSRLVAVSLFMKNDLDATSLQVSIYLVVSSGIHGIINFSVLPWTIKRFQGPWQAMAGATVLAAISSICFCFKFAYSTIAIFCALNVMSSLILPIIMTSANILCGNYAAKYTTNARTVVLGLSRFFFNIGQIVGPILSVALIQWSNIAQFSGITFIAILTWFVWLYFDRCAKPYIKAAQIEMTELVSTDSL